MLREEWKYYRKLSASRKLTSHREKNHNAIVNFPGCAPRNTYSLILYLSFYMKHQPHSQIHLRTGRLNKVKIFSFLQNLSETWPGKCELGSSKTRMPEVVLPELLGHKPSSVHHLPEIALGETLEHMVNSLLCVLFIQEGSKTDRMESWRRTFRGHWIQTESWAGLWEKKRIWIGTEEDKKRGFLWEKAWKHKGLEPRMGVAHLFIEVCEDNSLIRGKEAAA